MTARREQALPAVVGALAAALYLAIPAARYNFDGVACAIAIETNDAAHLVHGNHVAYGALGWALHAFLGLFGYQGPAVLSLQLLSSLLGAAGAAGFCRLLLNLGLGPVAALGASAGLVVSRLYWTWSLEAQVYPLGGAFLFWAAAELCRPKSRSMLAGALHGGAILGHVGNLMFAPAAWSQLPEGSARRRYALGLAATTGAGYLAALVLFVRPRTLFALRSWLLGSAALSVDRRFTWLGVWSIEGLGHWARVSLELLSGSWTTGAAAWAAAAFGAWYAWRARPKAARLALLWLAGYAVLYTNWQPMTIVYRYTDLPALWLLLACAAEAAGSGAVLGAVAAYLAVWNAGAAVVPGSKPELNPDLQRALWLARETPEDARIVVHAAEQVYVPYFAHREPLNIRYFADPDSLKARVRALRSAGQPVYAVPEVLPEWAARALAELGWRQVGARQDSRLFLIQ